MFQHYLKIAWRNIWNDKFYSLINLIGLTVAFTVVFLFMQWVRYELTFETDNPYVDRIYQVQTVEKRVDGFQKSMWLNEPDIADKYPIIEEAVTFYCYARSMNVGNTSIMYNQAKATPNFLKVFPLETVAGAVEGAEKGNTDVLISEEAANRIYGSSANALGQLIDEFPAKLKITAVVRVPKNSIIQFDILNLKGEGGSTYIMLKEGTQFTEEQQRIMANYLTEKSGSKNKLIFEPIKRLHLYTDKESKKVFYENIYFGSIKEIRMFTVIVLMLLLLAVINYVNTSTARAMSRAREVGVRKISGSTRRQLVVRFLTEAFIISFVAAFLAMDIAKVLHHPFERVMTTTFDFQINGFTVLLGLGMCLITTVLAGSYAAFYLSSLNPVQVLAGGSTKPGNKNSLRKILLGVQFAIAICVLICTWMVYRQLDYMLNKDLGFDREGIYYFNTSLMYQSEDFIKELQQSPYIENATMTMNPPYDVMLTRSGLSWHGAPQGVEDIQFAQIFCDQRFAETFGLEIVQGEFIPPGLKWWGETDDNSHQIVINETFKKMMGVDNPIGMTIEHGPKSKIIGVVKDFYFRPLSNEMLPLIMSFNPEAVNKMYIKTDPKHPKEALAHIRTTYDKMRNEIILLSTRPFIISPMEKEYRTIYKSETRLQQILMIFSLLSIVLSFMGIVGMVAFMIEKRTKEIGIRKINGAKWQDIVKEFWKEFLQLIAVAAIPAVVISFWLMHRWLQQYVYRPAFGWWIFLLVPLFIAAITALILLLQVQGIAKKNPVECLKSD
ncbi:MAG: FtsX-like permease family protein [Petrimonas sp.]|jgi:putative ABC transport system permease protein